MSEITPLQIVGAGPAGLSLMLALANRVARSSGPSSKIAQDLFDQLILFEASGNAGGRMGHYQINANTSSQDVVQGMDAGTVFRKIRDQYLSEQETTCPIIGLPRIEALMVQPLVLLMKEVLGSRLQLNSAISRINLSGESFQSFDKQGVLKASSENLVLCCGGKETIIPELVEFENKVVMSDVFLLQQQFADESDPEGPIIIIGASHSAFSCAWRLLNDPLLESYLGREIIMLQRGQQIKVRCTPEFAKRYHISYDPSEDVGKQNGLVYSHAGLRKDAKWLYLDIRDGREKRVKLKVIKHVNDESELLESAGLILQATGSRPDLPNFEVDGESVEVGRPTKNCELHRIDNSTLIQGLFGYGLGFNIVPEGPAAGEKSFNGGIHGFQSYPLALSPLVVDKIIKRLTWPNSGK